MNPWAIVIGAALGALKGQAAEKAAHEQRGTESTKTRWAGFTGVHGKDVAPVDHMGNIMQGASAGMMMGQNMGGGAAPAAPSAPMSNAYQAAPASQMQQQNPMFDQQNMYARA